jgi:actin-related protein
MHQHNLALFAGGWTTGMVVGSGADTSDVVPVYEGHSLPHAIKQIFVGGEQLVQKMAQMYQAHDSDFEQLRALKEERFMVNLFGKHLPAWSSAVHKRYPQNFKLTVFQLLLCLRRLKPTLPKDCVGEIIGCLSTEFRKTGFCSGMSTAKVELKNSGKEIALKNERFELAECFFETPADDDDEDYQFDADIVEAFKASLKQLDEEFVPELVKTVVLQGGNCRLANFRERFEEELKVAFPSLEINVVSEEAEPWWGGSNMVQGGWMDRLWIGEDAYEESGPSVMHRICTY